MASRRVEKWEAQRWLRAHSTSRAVRRCGRTAITGAQVAVVVGGELERASFRGLASCSHGHICPRCSARIASARAAEVRLLLAAARADGLTPMFLTLTTSHGDSVPLADSLAAIRACWRRLTGTRAWSALAVQGSVRCIEVTWGAAAGWHPHIHAILLVEDEVDAFVAFRQRVVPQWLRLLDGRGFTAAPFLQQLVGIEDGDDATSAYLVKGSGSWDEASEVAAGALKSGRSGSCSPFQLLAHAVAGDGDAARLWLRWEVDSHGLRALTWSRGLKKRYKIAERSDEAITAQGADGRLAAVITDEQMRALQDAPALLDQMLSAVEAGEPWGTVS